VLHGTGGDRSGIEVGLALTAQELDAASRLVHDCYLRRGYATPSADGRHVNAYLAMPSTAVFVARAAGVVAGTVSLVADGALRLPCDELYRAELAALRATGRRLAEVSALAVSAAWRGGGLAVIRALTRVVGVYARDVARLDDLCIAVHPRHAAFYEGLLRFRRFGGLRSYDAVNGAPALGLRLDLHELDAPLGADTFASRVFDPAARGRLRARLALESAVTRCAPRLQLLHSRGREGASGAAKMC
jgi:hypothetical protein